MTSAPKRIGFDVGGTYIRGLLVDQQGRALEFERQLRPEEPAAMVEAIVDITHRLTDAGGGGVVPVGVGCAGIVDRDGVVWRSPNIPTLVAFPLGEELRKVLDVPLIVDNDATTACWAEVASGAAMGATDAALVALGTGIGGGVVLDGEIRRGAHGFAGELGHMTIEVGGLRCACGRLGCWETRASGTALGRSARRAAADGRITELVELAGSVEAVRGEHLAALLADGHDGARELLDEHGYWVAVGMSSLVQILDVDTIVIGGGLSDVGLPLLDAVRDGWRRVNIDHGLRPDIEVELASFGGQAGAVGAALLAGRL